MQTTMRKTQVIQVKSTPNTFTFPCRLEIKQLIIIKA